jgi:CubicO group peptidase (beta-lactamase class C family)
MKKLLLISIAFLSLCTARATQPDSAITFRTLTDSIQRIMQEDHIAGLMLGIATKDSVLFTGGFGYADLAAQTKVGSHTRFRMGSITKMLVSLGILKLIGEGKLSLSTPLRTLAPEVPFANQWEATHPLLIVHLLEHTSGFDDIKLNSMYGRAKGAQTGLSMMLVQKKSMVCRWRPGERMAYCNPNYAILGYLIEKLSGMPYQRYLTDNILAPLGMSGSNFNLGSQTPQDVKEYSYEGGRLRLVESVTLLSGAAGSLWSNAADMAKLLQFFLRSGAPLYPAATIAEMETPHSSLAARNGIQSGYGLGNQDAYVNAQFAFRGHSGLVGTCFSSCYYNRSQNIGFVLSSNSNANNARIESLLVAYLQQNVPAAVLPVQPLDVAAVQPYLGRYQFESPRNALSAFVDRLQNLPSVYIAQGQLFYKPLGGKAAPLVQTGPLRFAWQGDNCSRLAFATNDRGHRVMLVGGSYYEKVSTVGSLGLRLLLGLAVLLTVLAALAGLMALAKKMAGRLGNHPLLPRLLPLLGVGGLGWAVWHLLNVQKYTYKLGELGSINARTLAICGGTALYAACAAATLLWAAYTLFKTKKGWGWLAGAVGMCLLAALLWQNGWIGLRTWAM